MPAKARFSVSSFRPMAPPPPPKSAGAQGKGKAAELTEPTSSLWAEEFSPGTRAQLAIHPRKVDDVNNWLTRAFDPAQAKYHKLLVLSGPSGAGKTATLTALAHDLDIQLVHFTNPSNHQQDYNNESLVSQFQSFLFRAGMTPALDLGQTPSSSTHVPSDAAAKRLILFEDLPNISHYPTKLALRSALAQYLASPRVTCPLVVIVSEAFARPGAGHESESLGGDGLGRAESVDSRSVCGVEVLQSPGCREISFNPIAVTIMKKALTTILDQVYGATKSGRLTLPAASRPSVKTLEIIIANSNGDIRSALMSLQFLAANPELAGATKLDGGPMTVKGKKRKSDDQGGGVSEAQVRDLLQFVTARESSLFIFHALGKVLYSKRWGESPTDDKKDLNRIGIEPERETDRLPRHLKRFRRKPSKVNPDVLFAEAPVDSDVFLSYVHHNFPGFTNTIEECADIIEGMSNADALMRMDTDDWLKRAPLTSSYSHAVAIRTTLLSLPSPVPHRSQVLRKSPLWESLRISASRATGLEEMGKSRGELGVAGGGLVGEGGGYQRSKSSLATELVPFLGLIRRKELKRTNPFLFDLATFPPAPTDTAPLSHKHQGETLDKNQAAESDEEGEQGDASDDGDEKPVVEELELEGEGLIDPDDDIED